MLKKIILPTLFLMFLAPAFVSPVSAEDTQDEVMQKCQMKRPEWYQCTTDADCVVSLNPCGWPVLGVNVNHKGRSEICTRQAGAFIDCPMWRDTPENQMVALCQEGVCEAVKASEAPPKETIPNNDSTHNK